MLETEVHEPLLASCDPPPVEIINATTEYPVILVCEHAGRAIPASLGSLGLDEPDLKDHIAWDIGAGNLARRLAERLGAVTVLQAYSRLVIDCNRPVDAADAMPEISDGVTIPGNLELTETDRRARTDEIFTPFQHAVAAKLDNGYCKAAFSIHSFTPVMKGVARPWDIGFLFRQDDKTSKRLAASVRQWNPDLVIGFNQPYQIDDRSDWFVPQHAERRTLPHSLIEVRNDHLRDDKGIDDWAVMLANAINLFAETL